MSPGVNLRGLRVFWTGLDESAGAILDAFAKQGAAVERHPLLCCEGADNIAPLPPLHPSSWVIFSSARAAEAVRGLPCPIARIAAVGPAAADVLASVGWRVDLVPTDQHAEGLAEAVIRETVSLSKSAFPKSAIFFRGDKTLPTITNRLRDAGFRVEEREVYATYPVTKERALHIASRIRETADIVLFGSPSGVDALASAVSLETLSSEKPRLIWTALGPTTESALRAAGISCPVVSKSPSPGDVVAAVREAVGVVCNGEEPG